MSLTPVEIRHVSLPRRLLGGYRRAPVDDVLARVADSFEDVWRERADLLDRVEQLEAEVTRHRELEAILRATLVSAERTAHELKDQATREARVIVEEAHAEARSIVREAAAEHERLLGESRRISSLLRSALTTVDDTGVRAVDDEPHGPAEAEAA
jgi:cell division initiation protein